MITGRPLEIDNVSNNLDGDTNLIYVSRSDILSTGFDEISTIRDEDLRNTLEVQFYLEVSMYKSVLV